MLRPGRFDRKVVIDVPEKKGRIKLLEVHTAKKKVETNVDFEVVAKRTPGFSGADIEALVNEAAIRAVRDKEAKGYTRRFISLNREGGFRSREKE